ncbi:MAG: glycosyltransferase family A protein [Actinomycetota bacterium]|nr:glycosyltransferase family A protein [Actinomycetota bacterium]
MAPTVSIGLTVGRDATHLGAAIDSILAQSFDDLELVIADAGSAEPAEALGREAAARDRRVRYHRARSGAGSANASNLAFALSRGRLYVRATPDDVFDRSFVARCVAALDQRPDAVAAYTGATIVDDRGHLVGRCGELAGSWDATRAGRRIRPLLDASASDPAVCVARREVLEGVSLPGLVHGWERALLVLLALHGPFVEVPEVLRERRVRLAGTAAWTGPTGSNGEIVSPWRMLEELGGAVAAAPVGRVGRLCALYELARWSCRPSPRLTTGPDVALRLLPG